MSLDLVVLIVVAGFAGLGAYSGALKQVGNAVGLGFAYFLSGPLAAAAAPAVAAKLNLPPAAVKIGLSAIGFYPLYLGFSIAIGFVVHKLFAAVEQAKWDRAAGAGLGALKGAVLVYIPLSLWVFMEGRLPGEVKEFVSVPDSASTRFVRAHNLFTKVSLPALSNVQKLMEAQKSPAAAEALLSDPHLKELLGNADLKKALTDPSVTQAFQSGDIEKMLKDPRIAKLLEDPRLSGQMPDLEKALKAEPEKTQP